MFDRYFITFAALDITRKKMVWSSPDMEIPRGLGASPEISSSHYQALSNKTAPSLISHYDTAFTSAYRIPNGNSPSALSSPSYMRGEATRYPTTTIGLSNAPSFHNSSPEPAAANTPTDPIYSTTAGSTFDSPVPSYIGNQALTPPATTMSFYNPASAVISNQHLGDYAQLGYASSPAVPNYFYTSGYPPLSSGYNNYPGMPNSAMAGKI